MCVPIATLTFGTNQAQVNGSKHLLLRFLQMLFKDNFIHAVSWPV